MESKKKMKKKSGPKTSPQLGGRHPPSFTRQPGNLPNYMKSTTSADARREGSQISTKRQSPRSSPDHSSLHRKDSTTSSGSLQVARGTCSSTLKICLYSYCSFNGHHVPPFKCFVSERRRALKVKLPKARPTGGRKEPPSSNTDQTRFFDKISGSQKSFDEEGFSTHSRLTSDKWDSVDLHQCLSSEKTSAPVVLVPAVKNDSSSQGNQTPSIDSHTTMFCNAMDGEQYNLKDIKHDKDQAESINGASTKDLTNEPYHGDSSEPDSIELNSRNKTEEKSSKHLSPAEPRAEKVNLRHQEVDARKNAEEWMVDFALRQAVTARQRKVALLVEAFERVVPTSK
ncbi:uncharacterized protein LOC131002330 [Salvia miltiorrhiza]|uniref:uncharacterized protein LOC131002330 n=1 Tax=Salvia miltiorrhiza TaxID=226208 RepID=UPI0025ACDF09|nr:uncharacterized protein LOC131002330 [Salvia miltiorrhiza]